MDMVSFNTLIFPIDAQNTYYGVKSPSEYLLGIELKSIL